MSQLVQVTLGELGICLSSWGFWPRMVDKLCICSLKHSTTVNRRHLPGVIEIGKMSLFHQILAALCKVLQSRWKDSFWFESTDKWMDEVKMLTSICFLFVRTSFTNLHQLSKWKTSFIVINSEALGQEALDCGVWHSINITKSETFGMTPN